ncbi:MAG: hypothetical protein PHS62_01420 [Patescibacteria group bacterium]|nr:hypothetical protein [Patescibacteria group bacterium]
MRKKFAILLILIFVLVLAPVNFSSASDLATRLKGKILLQVEDKGQAWYVEPKIGERHYMANGDEAYNIMRNLGVGITTKDLERIQNNKNAAVKHSGKIFLQVESHGEAYYVDFSGNLHYLKNGAEAFNVMRNLGLGITNSNLEKISISGGLSLPTNKNGLVSDNEINTTKYSEQKTDIQYSLGLQNWIKNIISLYKSNIGYAKNVIEDANTYRYNLLNAKSLLEALRDVETKSNYKQAYILLIEHLDKTINYCESTKYAFSSGITQMESTISGLERAKEAYYSPISEDRFKSDFNVLNADIKTADIDRKTLNDKYDEYVSTLEERQSEFSRSWLYMTSVMDYNYLAEQKAYKDIIASHQSSPITSTSYQPIIVPKFEMPKTTNCTISGDGGVGLQAYVNCTTY